MEQPLPPAIANDPRERKRYYLHMTPTRRVITFLLRQAFRAVMRLEVRGLEHFPRSGAVVLAANHLTNFDVFPMQFALPRPIFFMGKAELFRPGPVDALFRRLGGFPVYRGQQDAWAKHHALRVLLAGQVLGIFPEGTRSKGRGLKVGKTGAARFALQAACPIVPMAVDGTHRMFHDFPRRTRVRITIGEPILPRPYDNPLALTERLMYTIAAMLPPELRGVYADLPPAFRKGV